MRRELFVSLLVLLADTSALAQVHTGSTGAGCGPGHPPLLQPSQTTGAQFDQKLPLNVVAATQRELSDAFAPLVSDMDATDPAVSRPAPSGPPRLTTLVPTIAAPNSVLALSGYALGVDGFDSARVLFQQGNVERIVTIGSGGRALSRNADDAYFYMDVVVPADLTSGRWDIVIETNGRRSAPLAVEITDAAEPQLTGISPERAHPAQAVLLTSKAPAHVGDAAEVTDASGMQWRISTGASSHGLFLMLPDEIADGEARIRVGRMVNGAERFSAPLSFLVTSAPLPLKPLAVALMRPVAPGQWTDVVTDYDIEFEVRRVDRVDVEFHQGSITKVSRATGQDRVHVRVPPRLKPGPVSVRTRTWIQRSASEWSAPTTFDLLERAAAPTIISIEAGPVRNSVWWSGDSAPGFIEARPGDALVLRGHFPVARATALRVHLKGSRTTLALDATDVDGGVRVVLPPHASSGDWRLVIGTRDRKNSPQEITTVRVR